MAQLRHTEPRDQARAAYLVATICALLALSLRLWHLGSKSLWLDELLSWRAAHMSLPAMTHWSSGHSDAPLFYAILAIWVKAAGNSEVALRLPSAIAGTLAVFVLSWVAYRAGGALLGATAGLLLAVNGAAVVFSQEARMYPLTGLLALGASVYLARFVLRPTVLNLGGYAILATGLVYAHYSGWVVLTLHGALFLTYGVQHLWAHRDWRVLAGGIVAFALVGVAYIPWYSHFLHAAGTGVPIPAPSWDVVSGVTRALFGLDRTGRFWPVFVAPLLAFGIAGVARRLNDPMVVCVSALALVPVAMLDISIVRTPVFNLKQVSPFIPGVSFIAAIGIVEAGSLIRRFGAPLRFANVATLAAAIVIALIALRGTLDWYSTPPGEDWRAASTSVRDAQHPAYIWEWWASVGLDYYLGTDNAAQALPASMQTTTLDDGYVPITSAHTGDQATLVLTHAPAMEMTAILNSLHPYFSITEPTPYWGLHLYALRANSTAEFNVDLSTKPAWTTTPDGNLQTGDNASFTLRPSRDNSGFTLHVEYLDDGSGSFSISSLIQAQPVALTTIPLTGSNTWRAADVPVGDRSTVGNTFTMTPGVTIRTLEVRRYDVEGALVLRSRQSDFRQWFLRRDGDLETIGAGVCIWPTEHIDVSRTPTMTIDLTYLDHGAWRSTTSTVPAVDGLSCPISMPAPVVVRRLVVRTTP